MIRKVYTTHEEFHEQNKALGTDLPFNEDLSPLAAPLAVGTKPFPTVWPVRPWRAVMVIPMVPPAN